MLKLSAEGRAAEGAMASCSCRWRQIFSGIILRSNVKILLLVWRNGDAKKYCLWLQHQQLETLKRANRILRPKYMLRERIMVWWFADVNFLSGLIFLRSIKLIFFVSSVVYVLATIRNKFAQKCNLAKRFHFSKQIFLKAITTSINLNDCSRMKDAFL